MIRRSLALAGVLLSLSAVACGPDFQRIDITAVNTPAGPVQGQINYQRIVIPEGMIVTARIEPFNDNGKSMHGHVRSMNPSKLEISPAINDRVFAFIGQGVGQTQVEFYADDEVVLIVDAEVVPQQ
jgi:hypothetical protein